MMRISEIKYIASGQAARSDDIVTFYINFYRDGEFVDNAMVSGGSLVLNGTVTPIAPVEADSMVIEAVDLDFDSHALEINGRVFQVPKTGSKSVIFESTTLAESQKMPVLSPFTTGLYPERPDILDITETVIDIPGEPSLTGDRMAWAVGATLLLAVVAVFQRHHWGKSKSKRGI